MGFTDANRSEVLSQSLHFNPSQDFYVGGGQLGNIGAHAHADLTQKLYAESKKDMSPRNRDSFADLRQSSIGNMQQ